MELCTAGSLLGVLEEPDNYFGLCEADFLTVALHLSMSRYSQNECNKVIIVILLSIVSN